MLPNHLIPPIRLPGTARVDDTPLGSEGAGFSTATTSASSLNRKRHVLLLPRPIGWPGISPARAISKSRRGRMPRNSAPWIASTKGSITLFSQFEPEFSPGSCRCASLRLPDYLPAFLLSQTPRTDQSSTSSGPKCRRKALVET